jgi:hypothetical protein
MRKETFANYWLTNEHGKRRRSTWKMTEDEAKKRDPSAEVVSGTEEVRNIPDCKEEWQLPGDFMRDYKRR